MAIFSFTSISCDVVCNNPDSLSPYEMYVVGNWSSGHDFGSIVVNDMYYVPKVSGLDIFYLLFLFLS